MGSSDWDYQDSLEPNVIEGQNPEPRCDAWFEDAAIAPGTQDMTVIIVIAVCSAAILLCVIAIVMLVCYKRHLGCFKQEWEVKTDENSVEDENGVCDPNDPQRIYEGQREVDKKKSIMVTNGFQMPTNGTTVMTKGEPSGSKQPIPRIAGGHIANQSIVIVNKQPDVSKLRAKSLSKADSYDVQDIKKGDGTVEKIMFRKNVSERVLPDPQNIPQGGLTKVQQSLRAKDSNSVINAPSVYVQGMTETYGSHSMPPNNGHKLKASYDYGRSSNKSGYSQNSNLTVTKRESDYVYNNIPYSSSPDSSPSNQKTYITKDKKDDLMMRPSIPLQAIPQKTVADFNQPESKIDEALNQAARSHKVIEFTNFDQELKLIKIIGEGSFGKVYKAKWDAEFVAVKIFTNVNSTSVSQNNIEVASTQLSQSPQLQSKWAGTNGSVLNSNNGLAVESLQITTIDDEQYKELYAEIVLATSIPPHPNIVRINGFCRKPLCVVMEYMAGGSVQKLVYGLSNKPAPSPAEKFVIMVKACHGLKKLTEYGLHHRDVAARNILLGDYTEKIDSNTKVKITDFGMTRKDNDNEKVQKTKNDGGPYKWMAPESIQSQEYNEKTDVYMFAITMWEIMYGREPYENVDAINAAMSVCMKNERPEFLWDLPAGLKTLIKKCWDKEPNKRPTFAGVAKKLMRLQKSMASDLDENRAMDQVVEDEEEERQRQMVQYEEAAGILRADTNLSGGYEEAPDDL